MKPNQIFASMSPERCEKLLEQVSGEAPEALKQIVASAAVSLKFRPQFLWKQPPAKRAASVRRALARVGASPLAEELLAIYFLQCRLELLREWLDLLGLEHEDGVLQQEVVPSPDPAELAKHVASFRAGSDDEDRELLLRVFSAQSAIDWPALEALLEED